jgi:hypothetical protein
MLEKLSKMSTREAMITLAGNRPGYGELPRWLNKVAAQLGISFRTARSLWNGEISDENHLALKRLRERVQIEQARREARQLAQQYAQIAGGMRANDKDFYSTEIDRLERLARIIGALDRT